MSSEFWASSWKNFRGHGILNHTPVLCSTVFMDKNFVVRLSTTKTTKILPPEKYPLYGMLVPNHCQSVGWCLHRMYCSHQLPCMVLSMLEQGVGHGRAEQEFCLRREGREGGREGREEREGGEGGREGREGGKGGRGGREGGREGGEGRGGRRGEGREGGTEEEGKGGREVESKWEKKVKGREGGREGGGKATNLLHQSLNNSFLAFLNSVNQEVKEREEKVRRERGGGEEGERRG